MLIDTHSHIYDEVFDGDRDAVVARAREAGVGRILLPAVDGHSYGAMFETARRYAGYCFPMMGLHPTSVNDNPRYRDDLERMARLLEVPPDGIRFCGVGEVGLDLYWSRDFADEQLEALRFQIELALRYGLPLVIHTRDAWDEMCGVLEEYRGRGVRGVMHSFCGTREHYRRILGCGDFLFGVGGVVTFKRSAIAGLLPEIGIERAVLETDAPYLTPVPFRGKRNESAYVRYVCAKVAELCGTDERRVEEATERNVRAMFGDSIFC